MREDPRLVVTLVVFLCFLCAVPWQHYSAASSLLLEEGGENEDVVSITRTGDLVVLATVEGRIYGVNEVTGTVQWVLQTGKPLVSYKQKFDPILIPGIGGSSNIYYLDPTQDSKLQKLPVSIREIVSLSPFHMGDIIYIGSKETRIYAIDSYTGTLISSHSSRGADADLCPSFEGIPKDAILIGRSDYTIRAIDTLGTERWNITTGEFVNTLSKFYSIGGDDGDDDIVQSGSVYKTDIRGSLVCLDSRTGTTRWTFNPNNFVKGDRVISAHDPYQGIDLLKEQHALALQELNSAVYVDRLQESGFLYAIESLKLLQTGHEKQAAQLMLPSGDEVIEDRHTDLIAPTCFEPEDSMCLVGLHNISSDMQTVKHQNIAVVIPGTPDQHGMPIITIVAIGVGVGASVVSGIVLVAKRNQNKSIKTPVKKKKKEKKPDTKPKETNGIITIGKLEISPVILGYGSSGTIVFEGKLDGRRVAVKRMLSAFYKAAQREIQEEDKEFIYLALSYCSHTLADLMESETNRQELSAELMRSILIGLVQGLSHLHTLNIVHTDLKPQNVLLDSKKCVKISDMGLARLLEVNQSSFSDRGSGSFGWQAPELILAKEQRSSNRVTKKVDIFSLGCIMYYVLTSSDHPFGDRIEREVNIRNAKPALDKIAHLHEARDLISQMIQADPESRPTIQQVLSHPFFWTDNQKLIFLKEASDRYEIEKASSPMVVDIESKAASIVGTDWRQVVDARILDNQGKFRKYNYSSVRDVMRLIRNKAHHYWDLSEEVRAVVGPPPGPFLLYFESRFPSLFISAYNGIRQYCSQEATFKHYFQ